MAQSVQSMYNQMNDPSGLVWVEHSGTASVPRAVSAGQRANGQEVFVARAIVRGSNYEYLLVGKLVTGLGAAFLSEYSHNPQVPRNLYLQTTFQVLTNPNDVQIKWALLEGTTIHPNAVEGGFMRNTILYIGRAKYEGSHEVGYLYYSDYYATPADRHLLFNHSGTVHHNDKYEILLAKPKPACQCEMHCRLQLNCSKSCPEKK